MKKAFCFLFLATTCWAFAQDPLHFSKYKHVRYKKVPVVTESEVGNYRTRSSINFRRIAKLKGLVIKFQCESYQEPLFLRIYQNGKLMQKIKVDTHSYPIGAPDTAWVTDLDNNGLPDIKLIFPNTGCGLAGQLSTKVYLFAKDSITFEKAEFFDFSWESEYDLNNDSVYEILSCNHINYKGHSYWVYNAYNMCNGELLNLSGHYNYPLWTRHLYYSDYKVALGIPYPVRRKHTYEFPEW